MHIYVDLSGPIATLVAAMIGFLGGILSSFGLYMLRKRERRERLRKSLLTEIHLAKSTIEAAAEYDPETESEKPVHTQIPNKVYRSQMDQLGLLSIEELEPIITYYTVLDVAKEQLDNIENSKIEKEFYGDTAKKLKEIRNNAEESIKISHENE